VRLGIFGGTFNPIHFGHLRTAEEVRERAGLHKIIFMPSGTPPLKTEGLADASHRYSMAKIATDSHTDFVISDLELFNQAKSYTIDTTERLLSIYAGDDLYLMLGIDAFLDIDKWRQPDRLTGLIDFILLTRPGYSIEALEGSPYIDSLLPSERNRPKEYRLKGGRNAFLIDVTALYISSSMIRQLIGEGRSIRYLVPDSVERYIDTHGLYRR
jgi:nicotinate-nucleotide adenylyltransferase